MSDSDEVFSDYELLRLDVTATQFVEQVLHVAGMLLEEVEAPDDDDPATFIATYSAISVEVRPGTSSSGAACGRLWFMADWNGRRAEHMCQISYLDNARLSDTCGLVSAVLAAQIDRAQRLIMQQTEKERTDANLPHHQPGRRRVVRHGG